MAINILLPASCVSKGKCKSEGKSIRQEEFVRKIQKSVKVFEYFADIISGKVDSV